MNIFCDVNVTRSKFLKLLKQTILCFPALKIFSSLISVKILITK